MRTILCGAITAWAVLSGASSGPAQKPVIEEPLFNTHSAPPPSVSEMAQEANAVVVGTYTGAKHVIDTPIPGVESLRTTAFTFELTEVLKLDPHLPNVGQTIDVVLPGGEKELATQIHRLRLANADELLSDHAYVVFFRWNQFNNELSPAWIQDSLYDVSAETVRGVGRSSPLQDGLSSAAFLETLRNLQ